MRTGLRRSDVLFRTLGEAARAHHRRPPGARAHHRPPGPRLGRARRGGGRARASRSSTRSSCGATGVAPRLAAYAAGGAARSRRRAPARALTRRSPLPSPKTEITEIVTGAGHRRRAHGRGGPRRREAVGQRRRRRCGTRLIGAHAAGQHRQEFAAAWANGQAFLTRRRGPARATAVARGVEGPHPGARRRGGAGRPPRRPRVADQLQVPVQGARQRRAVAPLRARPGRRPVRPGRRRLVRGGRARRLPGAVRARSAASSAPARRCRPHAADLTPGAPRRAPRLPRRRLVTRRAGRLPRPRARGGQGVGRPLAPHPRQAHRGRGGPVAAAPHRQRALLRARRPARPLAPAPGDDPVGLAPGLRAQAHGRVGRRRRPAPGPLAGHRPRAGQPARSTPSTVTSRSAGATAASASPPRPRPTSTPPTTECPATSRWPSPLGHVRSAGARR